MKRPLFIVGIVFALGEVICRFCMDTEYIEAAVIGAVFLPAVLYFVFKTVLQDRAVFLYNKLSAAIHASQGVGSRQQSVLGGRKQRFIVFILGTAFGLGMLWGWIVYKMTEPFPPGTKVSGSFVITRLSEGDDGCSMELLSGNQRYYAYISYDELSESIVRLQVGQGYRYTGEIKELTGATNPGQFDHRKYLIGRGIRRGLDITAMKRVRKYDSGLRIMLDKGRNRLAEVVRKLMPQKYSGVLSAMLFGEKSWLDDDMRKLYQVNGIAHILAISSLHMAFFAALTGSLLKLTGIRRSVRAFLTILSLFLYGLMTGFSEATIRAFIMITAVLLAELFGRTADKPTAMATALLVMIIKNPDSILSGGFQMSYAAAVGLILSEIIYKSIYENERFKSVNKLIRKRYKLFMMGFISSVCLNVCMLPFIAGGYFEVPLYSMAVNFIILPLLFFAVAFGFAAALIGLFNFMFPIAKLVAYPAEIILRFYEWTCRFFMKLPLARINTGGVRVWEYIIYGGLLLVIVLCFGGGERKKKTVKGTVHGEGKNRESLFMTYEGQRRKQKIKCVLFLLSCVVLEAAFIIGTVIINRSGSYMVVLDVGQGNGSFVHSHGVNIIYDCGSSSKNDVGRNILVPALKYYSMSDIDMIFLSHSDADHINGLIYLLENTFMEGISVHSLCLAEGIPEDENLCRLLAAADKAGCKVMNVSAGDIVKTGEVRMEIIYPGDDSGENYDKNDHSLVMRYVCDGRSILFTGDISADVEKVIALDYDKEVDSDIVVCPHHGSKYSSSEVFIEAVSPETVIISCGKNNLYGHPAPEIIERYEEENAKIRRTDLEGAVVIKLP